MQISVMLSNLNLPFEEALLAVARMEIPAVQITLTKDDDAAKRRMMKQSIGVRGLKISAACVDAGDLGESQSEKPHVELLKPLIDATREICDDEIAICQTHVGIMPYTMQGARWDAFVDSCGALAEYSAAAGVCLAMETGPEPPRVMQALLAAVNSPGLGVNYDPANFIIWPGMLSRTDEFVGKTETQSKLYDKEEALQEFEPVDGVLRLAPYIVHTHAKDARGNETWADVPLGEGWVDWPRYLRLLQESGYNGYLAIEREGGEDRVGEISEGALFLNQQLRQLERETV